MMVEKKFASQHIQLLNHPDLKAPYMVMGFHGWSNAAAVSADTIKFIKANLGAQVFALINEEPFQDFATERPVGLIENGLLKSLDPCSTEIHFWQNDSGPHDVVFMLGKEPCIFWSDYCHGIFDLATLFGVQRIYTVGGVQDTISHTSQTPLTVVASNADLLLETLSLGPGIQPADYHGPVSIHSKIVSLAASESIDIVSIWAHVPAYLQRSPRAVAKVISIFNTAFDLGCPVDVLISKSMDLDIRINEAMANDPDLRQFVETIEGKPRLKKTSKSDKVIRLNDFVKRDPAKNPDN